MRRREFITLLGGAAAAWPLAVRAQQQTLPAVGFLSGGSPAGLTSLVAAFHRGLNETGHIENQNVAMEYRWAEGRNDRLAELATDLVRREVAVIAATTTPAVLAAKAATATIPIVFYVAGNPIDLGLVESLNRPGGNLTGMTTLTVELAPKRLELLHELVPATAAIGLLVNPTNPNAETQSRDHQTAARTLGRQVHVLKAGSEHDLDAIFASLPQLQVGALVIGTDIFFNNRRDQLIALAAHHRVPAIYYLRDFVMGGGLMSYGANLSDAYRQAGVYAGRILKGEKPADLPVQQSAKVELVINLKTARALGLEVPPTLLARADEVIE